MQTVAAVGSRVPRHSSVPVGAICFLELQPTRKQRQDQKQDGVVNLKIHPLEVYFLQAPPPRGSAAFQSSPSSRDRKFKLMSLWGMGHIETAAKPLLLV